MQSQISPQWSKAHRSLEDSMRQLDVLVGKLDTHYAGKIMALKAKHAQDGPYRKVLTDLRTDTKMVLKAIEANKHRIDTHEAKAAKDMIDGFFSEGSEVWDTHAGIVDEKKTAKYTHEAIKEWNDTLKRTKDAMLRKILSKSKAPKLLAVLAKKLEGVGSAERAFMGHNGRFNQSYAHFENVSKHVEHEVKHLVGVLKQTQADALKMEREAM